MSNRPTDGIIEVVVITPLPTEGVVILYTVENLKSSAVSKIVYETGETDSYDIETGKLCYTQGLLFVTFLSGKTYRYSGVSVDEFTELVTSVSIGRNLNENIKPFKHCALVEAELEKASEFLDFGGRIWTLAEA